MAGRIRDADIAEVRDRNPVEDVIGEYVALRRAGAGSVKGLCPFHDEKSPSFNVRPAVGTYHCFGCGEGGDAVAFLMKIEVVGFVEAVERLAARVGYRLTYEGGGSSVQRERNTRSRLLEANRAAAEFYAAQLRLPEAAPAVQFLTSRGFDVTAATTFGCGYAPAGWDTLTKHLIAAGFSVEELTRAGLSKEGRRGPIDRFHRRLLWPIRDLNRVESVVGEYVALRPAGGGNLKGLCPFHDEKSPSFNVRPSHGSYHCFGCGQGGDVFSFIAEIEHLSFTEAVERLADRVGFQLTRVEGGSSVRAERGTRSRLIAANKAAAAFYAERLSAPDAEPARAFLAER